LRHALEHVHGINASNIVLVVVGLRLLLHGAKGFVLFSLLFLARGQLENILRTYTLLTRSENKAHDISTEGIVEAHHPCQLTVELSGGLQAFDFHSGAGRYWHVQLLGLHQEPPPLVPQQAHKVAALFRVKAFNLRQVSIELVAFVQTVNQDFRPNCVPQYKVLRLNFCHALGALFQAHDVDAEVRNKLLNATSLTVQLPSSFRMTP
jgi:hypothetical protein